MNAATEPSASAVLDRDLRLAVGAQPPERAILAHVGELLAQARRDQVRERHAVSSLVRGVAKHDALVAGVNVQVQLAHVHAARDVGRLLLGAHQHSQVSHERPLDSTEERYLTIESKPILISFSAFFGTILTPAWRSASGSLSFVCAHRGRDFSVKPAEQDRVF